MPAQVTPGAVLIGGHDLGEPGAILLESLSVRDDTEEAGVERAVLGDRDAGETVRLLDMVISDGVPGPEFTGPR